MPTVVADGIGDVVSEVRAPRGHGGVKQFQILLLGKMLVQITMIGRATVKVTGEPLAAHLEFVEDILGIILDNVEVGIIAVAGREVAVALIPFGEFDAEIFCRSVTFVTSQYQSLSMKSLLALTASSRRVAIDWRERFFLKCLYT